MTILELLLFIPVGILLIVIGVFCLRQYEGQLRENFFGTTSWDVLSEAFGAGGSWGQVAVILLFAGVCMTLFGVAVTGLVAYSMIFG